MISKAILIKIREILQKIWNILSNILNRQFLTKIYILYARILNINRKYPPNIWYYGGPEIFKKIGHEIVNFLLNYGGLKKTDKVLEIGCGVGRNAFPLINYLVNGKYDGFDIDKENIAWLRANISLNNSNFRFHHSDIYNNCYNPKGKILSKDYKLPFDNKNFDFIFLISVFTHMLPNDIDNYLSEISRMLRKNKRCLISFFLINEKSKKALKKDSSFLKFEYVSDYYTINTSQPEIAIAYDEDFIRNLFKKYELEIIEPIYYGDWSKNKILSHEYHLIELSFQDIVIAKKK